MKTLTEQFTEILLKKDHMAEEEIVTALIEAVEKRDDYIIGKDKRELKGWQEARDTLRNEQRNRANKTL